MENAQVQEHEVRMQLERILASDLFQHSAILHDFLSYIVNQTLSGQSMILKEYTIGTSVLSKKNNYDPQSDASVRIHAGRLRKALNSYYSGVGAKDPVFIDVPKGSYVPVFSYNTPSIYKEVADGRKLYSRPTLAVLPFHVYDKDKDEALADGLCDQLSTDFASFNEVTVISYYSVRRIAAQENDLRKLVQLLDVNYILTGNIQSVQDEVRIRVQLNAANSMEQIWAATYERNRKAFDTFTLQDSIVKHVVNLIGGSLGIINRNAVRIPANQKLLDVKVYDAVFWYYYLVRELDEKIFAKAVSSMKEAVKLDPNYALGWAVLAETCVAGHFYGFPCTSDSPLDDAVSSGRTALKLDKHCHHAYQALALAYVFRHEKENCLAIARDWLSLQANIAGISGGIGFCLICCGEYEKGYQMIIDSIQLNPYYPWWFNAGISLYHLKNGEHDDAVYWADKLHDYTQVWELLIKTTAYAEADKQPEAMLSREALHKLIPDTRLETAIHSFIQDPSLTRTISQQCRKAEKIA